MTQVLESSEEESEEENNNGLVRINHIHQRSAPNKRSYENTNFSNMIKNDQKKPTTKKYSENDEDEDFIFSHDENDECNFFDMKNNHKNDKIGYKRFCSTENRKAGSYNMRDEDLEDEFVDSPRTNFDLKKYYFPGRF